MSDSELPWDQYQLACLQAMGITVWARRAANAAPPAELAVSESDPAEPMPAAAPSKYATPTVESANAGSTALATASPSIDQLDWEALQARVAACTACPLHERRTQTVFGVGHRQADWLFIGEAPGADEDRQGEPFVGRAGKLLDQILFALGQDRSRVYIANVCKCRPPGNREPTPAEALQCWPYLSRQIQLIGPQVIVAMGRIAAHRLLQTDQKLGDLRQQVHPLNESATPVIVTYHPAYLLRNPADKRKVWEDLLFAGELVRG